MQNTIKTPLSNVQLEILKSFSHQLSNDELKEFKNNLANFFSKRLIKEADKTYDKNNWNDDKIDTILETKLRKK